MYMYLLDANIFAHVLNFFSTGETGFAIILLKMQCAHLLFIKLHDQKMLFLGGDFMFTMIRGHTHHLRYDSYKIILFLILK